MLKMGLLDKAKFWKKDKELDDMSDLGDFGLEETTSTEQKGIGADDLGLGEDFNRDFSKGTQGAQMPGRNEEPTMGEPAMAGQDEHQHNAPQGMQQDTMHHDLQGSVDMPSSFEAHKGMEPAGATAPLVHDRPYHEAIQQPMQVQGLGELAKDIEIIHAKLDAIKSSLDSVNQRLATLERIATGDSKTRYSW